MAQSANTFSIFDNNSFDGFRVTNHKLVQIAKSTKNNEMNIQQETASQLGNNFVVVQLQ